MTMGADSTPSWVADLCGVVVKFRGGNRSFADLVRDASPEVGDEAEFLAAVTAYLREHPELCDAWSGYSADKRSAGPYFRLGTPSEVGNYAGGYHDVRSYHDPTEACADYLWREIKK